MLKLVFLVIIYISIAIATFTTPDSNAPKEKAGTVAVK